MAQAEEVRHAVSARRPRAPAPSDPHSGDRRQRPPGDGAGGRADGPRPAVAMARMAAVTAAPTRADEDHGARHGARRRRNGSGGGQAPRPAAIAAPPARRSGTGDRDGAPAALSGARTPRRATATRSPPRSAEGRETSLRRTGRAARPRAGGEDAQPSRPKTRGRSGGGRQRCRRTRWPSAGHAAPAAAARGGAARAARRSTTRRPAAPARRRAARQERSGPARMTVLTLLACGRDRRRDR